MLPICTWTVLMGQVLTLGVDMMNLLLSFVCCTSSQGRFKRSQGTVSVLFALNGAFCGWPGRSRDCLCYRKDVLD